jgi:hypothetical protein
MQTSRPAQSRWLAWLGKTGHFLDWSNATIRITFSTRSPCEEYRHAPAAERGLRDRQSGTLAIAKVQQRDVEILSRSSCRANLTYPFTARGCSDLGSSRELRVAQLSECRNVCCLPDFLPTSPEQSLISRLAGRCNSAPSSQFVRRESA